MQQKHSANGCHKKLAKNTDYLPKQSGNMQQELVQKLLISFQGNQKISPNLDFGEDSFLQRLIILPLTLYMKRIVITVRKSPMR